MKIVNWGRELQEDIGESIFGRLVVSNLATCRVVCKTWNSLILDYSSSSKLLTNDFILFTRDGNPICGSSSLYNPKMHCFRLDDLDVDSDMEFEVNKFASLRFDGDWSFILPIRSCNGLLLISKSTFYCSCMGIFNPMTNEFFRVPRDNFDANKYVYGFGFIPTTKHYKLFRITIEDEPSYSSRMEVLTFGRGGINPNPKQSQNQWRHLYSIPSDICCKGAYFNGIIYWLGREKDEQNEYVIYTLDVESEKIKLSAVLKVGPFSHYNKVYIQQFNGSVYAIFHILPPTTNERIQVWKMEEKDSWIRDFVIDDENLKDLGSFTP
ncbi:uncharacterized protein LOC120071509 [Benincasa hispida]|uniref:uncharacterized protein LOC120071509 n=1 Tax=Benincasa hispida TaxID=102211 RepID=UPI0018FFD0CE|nr:uncharacterized protein LOC120071509 [Benincasa hispida]